MKKSCISLLWFLLALAGTTAIIRPPFLRSLILPAVASRLGIAIQLRQATGHGLLNGLHLHRLKVASNQTPLDTFLSVGTLRIQSGRGTLWNPDTVLLEDAILMLRFGKDGKLLTSLPDTSGESGKTRPKIEIRNGSLSLTDNNRTPWVLHGIDGTMVPVGSHYHLKARVNDPELGLWHADVTISGSPTCVSIQAHSNNARLHMPSLKRLPFIPPSTWQQVHLEGRAKATLTMKVTLATTTTQLKLTDPDIELKVPIVDLTCHLKEGRALIEPERITLDQLAGAAWGGELRATKATLEFPKNQSHLVFDLSGTNLDSREILKHNGNVGSFIPPGIKAGGQIHLDVLLTGQRHWLGGNGEGTVRSGIFLLPWSLSSYRGNLIWKGPWGSRSTLGTP